MQTHQNIHAWIFSDAPNVPDRRPSNPNVKDVVTDPFHFNHHNVTETGIYRVMGWAFDLRPLLTRYIVKSEHYGLIEMYSLNKTTIRKTLKGAGRIHYITEAPKQ